MTHDAEFSNAIKMFVLLDRGLKAWSCEFRLTLFADIFGESALN